MNRLRNALFVLLMGLVLSASAQNVPINAATVADEPAKAATPPGSNRAILDFLNLRFGMLIHFGMSTFHGEQWAYPFRDPRAFRPTKLDASQWAKAARSAGIRYAVFTTKHHDGFCLWPTKTTGYNVSKCEPALDMVRSYVDAFRKEGLKVGLYYSVMDWHDNIESGTVSPAKVQMMKDQLTELLTHYGPIECIVTDGWGSKWGGPSFGELPFKVLAEHIHSIQPDCLLVNHACVAELEVSQVVHYEATHGQHCTYDNILPSQQGPTLQSAWFWNPGFENEPLKPAEAVAKELRYANGRYCNYLLNCAPNKDGLMDDNVLKRLEEIGKQVSFPPDITGLPAPARPHRAVTANSSSATQGNEPGRVLDANLFTRWIPEAEDKQPWIELDFGKPEAFNAVVCGEYARNIRSFRIEAKVDGKWQEVLKGGDIKHHFQASFPEVTAQRYRVTLLDCNPSPWLAEVTFIRY